MTIHALAALPRTAVLTEFSADEKRLAKDLEREIKAAKAAGFVVQTSDARRKLRNLELTVWHRVNPTAFDWVDQGEYMAHTTWANVHHHNIETGKGPSALPVEVLEHIPQWSEHFDRLELHRYSDDTVIFGDFGGRRARLARWNAGSTDPISIASMDLINQHRGWLQKMDDRWATETWLVLGGVSGFILVGGICTALTMGLDLPKEIGWSAFVGAIVGGFGGLRLARWRRRALRVPFVRAHPELVPWIE